MVEGVGLGSVMGNGYRKAAGKEENMDARHSVTVCNNQILTLYVPTGLYTVLLRPFVGRKLSTRPK